VERRERGEEVERRELQNVGQRSSGGDLTDRQKTTRFVCDRRLQWICSHLFCFYSAINCAVQDLAT